MRSHLITTVLRERSETMREYIDICETFDVRIEEDKLKFFACERNDHHLSDDQFLKLSIVKQHERSVVNYLNHPPIEYSEVIGVDIETTSLNFRTGEIRLIALYSEGRQIVTENLGTVKSILADPKILKVFHNCLFDVPFLEFNGYAVETFTDTMVMAQIIENNSKMISLDNLARLYLGFGLNKQYQHASNWEGDLTGDHYRYCLEDARVAFELYGVLFNKIVQSYLFPTYRREVEALPAVVELTINGIYLDFDNWSQRLRGIEKEVTVEKQRLEELLKCSNIDSYAQLKNALNENGIALTRTDEKTLNNYTGKYPILLDLLAYRKLKKVISSYGEKIKVFLGDDGRVRSQWQLVGTKTSRMTASKPSLQSMPKDMRSFFKASEGCTFIIGDYSTIELRILAEIAKIPALIGALNEGVDLHKHTASIVFNSNLITPEQRQIGKAINFGIVYGLTPYGLANQINSIQKSKISEEDARVFLETYFNRYPELKSYQDKLKSSTYIETLGGRYWCVENGLNLMSDNQRLNFAIQASCAEGLKEALALIMMKKRSDWRLVNCVHDEVVIEVPYPDRNEARQFLERQMISGMETLVRSVSINVETKISNNWIK